MSIRKVLCLGLVALSCFISSPSSAKGRFTLNINGYSTNYIMTGLCNAVLNPISAAIIEADDECSYVGLVPKVAFMFPVSVKNSTNDMMGQMYMPYKTSFKWPWKHLGDCNLGLDMSYDQRNTPFGLYFGCHYKSNEIVTADHNQRIHYVSPVAGLRLRYKCGLLVEVGTSYDVALKYHGYLTNSKDCVNSGFNADFGLGLWSDSGIPMSLMVKYIHPLYNTFNSDYVAENSDSKLLEGVDRRLGYVSLAFRIGF